MSRLANLWEETAVAAPRTAPLDGPTRADVVVIGAGYLGLSAALHIAEAGGSVGRARSPYAGLWRLRPQWRPADSGTEIRSRRHRSGIRSRTRRAAVALRRRHRRFRVRPRRAGSVSRRRLAAPPGSRASIRRRPRSSHAPAPSNGKGAAPMSPMSRRRKPNA